ncbi:class I SAM-dependent methyltransferase [Bacillus sp. KH172YL63]|uniref:class I SAM-dependent methyltransferase n=1 Tax=Bacillus sp. KH172YL63 TaxID=2709784 RepID=UPI0013E4C6B9|nr:class I SAM-dependent methyltransferase [Bacillus sp. KH172YL63]BCB03622.1 hypothetical protein KH172YL63_17550 [Bacillus sp. KH172YL63]
MIDEGLKKQLADSYNRKSTQRNDSPKQDWKVRERKLFYSMVKKEGNSSLLELGAGTGWDSLYFNEKGIATFSTDLSPQSVDLCREKGLKAEVMSFDQLAIPDEGFEAVWALNCLLHVPKDELPIILNEIKRVLAPNGLFYMGVYGGRDFEGTWREDHYVPKRFFSFYEEFKLKEVLSQAFKIEYFNTVPKETVGGDFDFQSIILRKEER